MMFRLAAASAFAFLLVSAPSMARPSTPAPKGDTAVIKGKINLDGKPGKDRPISLEADKYCSDANPGGLKSETFKVGAAGEFGNVFVWIKKGLPADRKWEPKGAVTLDQRGCRYEPHVFGIMVNQDLKILNSDDTLHNIHAVPQVNPEFNFGMAKKGEEAVRKFATPEIGVKIKCDVHGWMQSWAHVVPHPFFAVTGDAGTFEIKDLPAGEYEVEAWHEKLGTLQQAVKVGDGESKEANFTFKGK